MIGVHFHVLDEFLTELDRHAEDDGVSIEREIVRATPMYRQTQLGIRICSVMASFVSTRYTIRDYEPGVYTRHDWLPELVHVSAVAGGLWGHEKDGEVEERRDAMMAALAVACERHGLELRSGFHEARA